MRRHHPDSTALPGAAWQLLVLVGSHARRAVGHQDGDRASRASRSTRSRSRSFAMQIYADFSAYTSLARGSARAAAPIYFQF